MHINFVHTGMCLIARVSLFVTGFAKRGLPHTSNLLTLTIYNFRLVKAIDMKFGKQEAPT